MSKTNRILMIEDNDEIRRLTAEFLREDGFVVSEARNSDEAISFIERETTFDLVFTDVRIPGTKDGIGIAERVREIHPDLPILITTGYPVHIDKQISTLGPPTSYLSKPYRLAEASAVVKRLLGITP